MTMWTSLEAVILPSCGLFSTPLSFSTPESHKQLLLLTVALSIFVVAEETTFEAGVKVQIHSQSEPPFIQELGFGVAPGFQTFVATQEQRVSSLGFPDWWSSA